MQNNQENTEHTNSGSKTESSPPQRKPEVVFREKRKVKINVNVREKSHSVPQNIYKPILRKPRATSTEDPATVLNQLLEDEI